MINLCNTMLPKDRVQAIPANMGKTTKPIPVIDKVIEFDVAPMIIILLMIIIVISPAVFFVPL